MGGDSSPPSAESCQRGEAVLPPMRSAERSFPFGKGVQFSWPTAGSTLAVLAESDDDRAGAPAQRDGEEVVGGRQTGNRVMGKTGRFSPCKASRRRNFLAKSGRSAPSADGVRIEGQVAELAYALASGASGETLAGSNPALSRFTFDFFEIDCTITAPTHGFMRPAGCSLCLPRLEAAFAARARTGGWKCP